jgi:hypothetical protein
MVKYEGITLEKNTLLCNQPIVGSEMKPQIQILDMGLQSDMLSSIL